MDEPIKVSPEMIAAGVDALRLYQESYAEAMLAEAVYTAMAGQRVHEAAGWVQEEESSSLSSRT